MDECTFHSQVLTVSRLTMNMMLGVPSTGASQVALVAKNLTASAGYARDWVRSLGQEDLLKKGKAAHSSILAWRFPWTEESGGLRSVVSHRIGLM